MHAPFRVALIIFRGIADLGSSMPEGAEVEVEESNRDDPLDKGEVEDSSRSDLKQQNEIGDASILICLFNHHLSQKKM